MFTGKQETCRNSEPVKMPDCLHYLWGWFCELSGGRGYAEFRGASFDVRNPGLGGIDKDGADGMGD